MPIGLLVVLLILIPVLSAFQKEKARKKASEEGAGPFAGPRRTGEAWGEWAEELFGEKPAPKQTEKQPDAVQPSRIALKEEAAHNPMHNRETIRKKIPAAEPAAGADPYTTDPIDLSNPDEIRKAIVASEILTRKYE